jgi:hypothetical protein
MGAAARRNLFGLALVAEDLLHLQEATMALVFAGIDPETRWR